MLGGVQFSFVAFLEGVNQPGFFIEKKYSFLICWDSCKTRVMSTVCRVLSDICSYSFSLQRSFAICISIQSLKPFVVSLELWDAVHESLLMKLRCVPMM